MKTVPLIDQISAAKVTAKQLEAMSREANAMREQGGDGDATFAALRVFGKEASAVAMVAAVYRMEALCHLVEAGALAKWTSHRDADGAHHIATECFSAAASTPLRLSRRSRRVWFNRKAFVQNLMRSVAPEGRA
jgi:hypothetical protein